MAHEDVIRRVYGLDRTDLDLPATSPIIITAERATATIVVLRILFAPTTYTESVVSFVDRLTGQAIGTMRIPSLAAVDVTHTLFELDFRPTGTSLSTGADLVVSTTAGAHGRLHGESYQRG